MDTPNVVEAEIAHQSRKLQLKHEYRMAEIELRKRYAEIDERRVAVEEKRLALQIAVAKHDGVVLD